MPYRILWFSFIATRISHSTPMCLPPRPPSHLPPARRQPISEPLSELPAPSAPALSHTAHSQGPSLTHGAVRFCYSVHTLPLPLLFSCLVHRSVLYVCFSTATLKINSSMPSLQIPYVCVSIQYLYLSF